MCFNALQELQANTSFTKHACNSHMGNSSLEGLEGISSQLSYLLSPHLHTNVAISVFLSKFFPFFFLFILRTLFPDPVELQHVRGHFEPWHTSCLFPAPTSSAAFRLESFESSGNSSAAVFKHSASSSIWQHSQGAPELGTASFASQSQGFLV